MLGLRARFLRELDLRLKLGSMSRTSFYSFRKEDLLRVQSLYASYRIVCKSQESNSGKNCLQVFGCKQSKVGESELPTGYAALSSGT